MKISEEQALQELQNWYDRKKFSRTKLKAVAFSENPESPTAQDILTDAISEGALVINEDGSLSLQLEFPTLDGEGISELKFKARMTLGEKTEATKGLKPDDGEGRLIAYIAKLTNQPQGVIKALDAGVDFERAGAIAVYFL